MLKEGPGQSMVLVCWCMVVEEPGGSTVLVLVEEPGVSTVLVLVEEPGGSMVLVSVEEPGCSTVLMEEGLKNDWDYVQRFAVFFMIDWLILFAESSRCTGITDALPPRMASIKHRTSTSLSDSQPAPLLLKLSTICLYFFLSALTFVQQCATVRWKPLFASSCTIFWYPLLFLTALRCRN